MTRNLGLRTENQQVNVTFGEGAEQVETKREMPVWMQQSTVTSPEDSMDTSMPGTLDAVVADSADDNAMSSVLGDAEQSDEITSLLLRHEKRGGGTSGPTNAFGIPKYSDSDKSDESDGEDTVTMNDTTFLGKKIEREAIGDEMSNDDDDDDGEIPTVKVGDEEITLTDINEDIISRMTAEEKEKYTQVFQDFYSHVYD